MSAWANLYLLGQPDTFLAQVNVIPVGVSMMRQFVANHVKEAFAWTEGGLQNPPPDEKIFRCNIYREQSTQDTKSSFSSGKFYDHIDRGSDDDGTGHIFMLHFLRDGRIAHYQSFIRQYTLPQWLQQKGFGVFEEPLEPYYSATQMQSFFKNVDTILASTEWTDVVDVAYERLCGMSPNRNGHSIRQAASLSAPQMRFYCDLACVRPRESPVVNGNMYFDDPTRPSGDMQDLQESFHREIFTAADRDHDKFLVLAEFRAMLTQDQDLVGGYSGMETAVDSLHQEFDTDGDGRLSFKEYHTLQVAIWDPEPDEASPRAATEPEATSADAAVAKQLANFEVKLHGPIRRRRCLP
jgi:hypothetical protein